MKRMSFLLRVNDIRLVLVFPVLLLAGCNVLPQNTPTPHLALTFPGAVLCYPFDGNADDISENHNDGQVHGAILTEDRFGMSDSAYYFDGVDDYISFDASKMPLGASPRTITAWIKADGFPPDLVETHGSRATVIGWGISNWDQLSEMQIVSTRLCFHYYGNDNFSGELLAADEWYQLSIVYTHETVSLYINGVEERQEASVINTPIGTGRIGAYPDPETEGYDSSYFHGTIDDVCVYDRALTEEQINVLYGEGGWEE